MRWWDQIRAGGQPPNLITDPEYVASLQAGYKTVDAQAEAPAAQADEAGRSGDSHILTTAPPAGNHGADIADPG